MSELDSQKPPDTGGEESYRDEATPFSSVQRTPHNRPPSGDPSVQNLFGNPNLHSQTPPTAACLELQKNMADARMRDFLARKRKSRELQLGRYLQDRRLSVFSNDDKVAIMAHANFLGSDAVDYLQAASKKRGVTIGIMLTMFSFQSFIRDQIDAGKLPVLFGLTFFFPKMVYANVIGVLNSAYKSLCTWLNDKENYREQSSHENHLILKIVLFQFINSYLSLFYIAFYLQDTSLLQAQLFALFISKQMTGNLKESIIPYIQLNTRVKKSAYLNAI